MASGRRDRTQTDDATRVPCAGYRVLEIGSTVAGPFCGRMLADFGAEVIKVEPAEGDPVRTMGKRYDGHSLYAASIFRNKKLVSIDLHREEGRALIRELAAKCDVLVENFKPGTLEKWGLGWEDLSQLNPRLVMVRISGFGQDGPYSQRPGYGVVCEAVSGLRHLTGDPDRAPSRVGVSMTDYIAGLHGAYGAVMALMAREKTGRGQFIDAALYESAFNFMEVWIRAYEKTGFVPNRTGSRLIGSTPNNLYPTADGTYIHITAMADSLFRRLCGAMGQPELADDPRFAAPRRAQREPRGARRDHRRLDDGASAGRSRGEAAGGVGAGDAHLHHRGHLQRPPLSRARLDHRGARPASRHASPWRASCPRLSDTPGGVRHAGRDIGQDSRAVLREVLGMDDARIDALAQEGVVAA